GESMTNVKCQFTSVWGDGTEITTNCIYDTDTGKVSPESFDAEIDDVLVREYITLEDKTEIEVCTNCHEYTSKLVMGERSDLSYGEYWECMNPDCSDCWK